MAMAMHSCTGGVTVRHSWPRGHCHPATSRAGSVHPTVRLRTDKPTHTTVLQLYPGGPSRRPLQQRGHQRAGPSASKKIAFCRWTTRHGRAFLPCSFRTGSAHHERLRRPYGVAMAGRPGRAAPGPAQQPPTADGRPVITARAGGPLPRRHFCRHARQQIGGARHLGRPLRVPSTSAILGSVTGGAMASGLALLAYDCAAAARRLR